MGKSKIKRDILPIEKIDLFGRSDLPSFLSKIAL
jgi:hypothetical protein